MLSATSLSGATQLAISYDEKLCQVKTNIVNCTEIRLKLFKKVNSSQKICWYGRYLRDTTIKFKRAQSLNSTSAKLNGR